MGKGEAVTYTFRVKRVSLGAYSKELPCEEAVNTGEQEQVARDTSVPIYTVSFTTLEELMGFIAKHGEIILDEDALIIYDDRID